MGSLNVTPNSVSVELYSGIGCRVVDDSSILLNSMEVKPLDDDYSRVDTGTDEDDVENDFNGGECITSDDWESDVDASEVDPGSDEVVDENNISIVLNVLYLMNEMNVMMGENLM